MEPEVSSLTLFMSVSSSRMRKNERFSVDYVLG
jgi:hypothetical protein